MFNLIKMDTRRLTRMRSFWIMIAVVVLMAAMSVYIRDISRNMQQDMTAESGGFFVAVEATPEQANDVDFTDLVNNDVAGLNLAMFCAIFVPLFVNAEQKNGYIKNIAGQLPNRSTLVLSKLVAVAVQVFVMFALYILTMAVAGKIFLGDDLVFGAFGAFAKVISLHYLLHLGFAALIMALTIFTRGSGLSMTYGILASSGMIIAACRLLSMLLHKCGVPSEFSLGDYTLEACITAVMPSRTGSDLTKMIVEGVAFLVVSTVAAMVVMRKRDVK